MFKKLNIFLFFILLVTPVYADVVDMPQYGAGDTLTASNLNQRWNLNTNQINGGLNNTNADTTNGFRFHEILGSLPAAGNEGRTVFLTSDDTLYFDDGSSFRAVAMLANTQTFSGNNTFTGTADFQGNVTLGSATGDDIKILGSISASIPLKTELLDIGTTALGLNDLHFGSGGIINWDGSDITLTHTANTLTFSDTTNTINFSSVDMDSVDIDSGTIGAVTIDGAPTMSIGSDADGDVYYRSSNVLTRLAKGAGGQVLRMNNAATAPEWGGAGSYWEEDTHVLLSYSDRTLDRSRTQKAATPTNLGSTDLVLGKVSAECYDYDGSEEKVVIADDADFDSITSELTVEAWVNKATTGTQAIISDITNNVIRVAMTDTVITGQIKTASGDETFSEAHGLSSNGTGQWAYIVVVWDSSAASTVYVNGVDVGDGDDAGNGNVSAISGFNIGTNQNSSADWWNGDIDGIRILYKRMTPAEILFRTSLGHRQ